MRNRRTRAHKSGTTREKGAQQLRRSGDGSGDARKSLWFLGCCNCSRFVHILRMAVIGMPSGPKAPAAGTKQASLLSITATNADPQVEECQLMKKLCKTGTGAVQLVLYKLLNPRQGASEKSAQATFNSILRMTDIDDRPSMADHQWQWQWQWPSRSASTARKADRCQHAAGHAPLPSKLRSLAYHQQP